jgi:nucleotide-binding universal stress UspA family protein
MEQMPGVSSRPVPSAALWQGSSPSVALVPLDCTPNAESALPYAVAHARATGDRLVLAGIESRPAEHSLARVAAQSLDAALAPVPLVSYLRQVAGKLNVRGLAVETSICGGMSVQSIADATRLWGANLVIMALHNYGGSGGNIESIVANLLRRTAVAVLLVPAAGAPVGREDRLIDSCGGRVVIGSRYTGRTLDGEGSRT